MSSDFMPQALDSLLASQRASVYGSSKTGSSDNSWMEDYEIHQKGEDMGLDFTDYLQLMVQQLQNQTMDNTTDTSDMLNQLVQMSVVQMMTTVKTSIDTLVDANTLTYAASLVGIDLTGDLSTVFDPLSDGLATTENGLQDLVSIVGNLSAGSENLGINVKDHTVFEQ